MLDPKYENGLLFATVSIAIAVGIFILWGPNLHRKKKGHVIGLVNLGYTCFLNTLVQALASCPIFLDWLSKQQDHIKKKSIISSLQNTLQAINGKNGYEDPYTPSALIHSLYSQGWVISPGEQDAHELFHIIVTSLEEETQHPISKVCSLSDAVENVPKQVQSEMLQKLSPVQQLRATVSSIDTSSWWQIAKHKGQNPFQGLFTSQLQCMNCNYKSVVQYSTFYSLSLVLPPRLSYLDNEKISHYHTLQELIANFVTNRVVSEVICEGCRSHGTDQVKTVNFGKLPICLCIHIARTTWEGEPLKRDDYIEFPEILIMDPYTYNYVQQAKMSKTKGKGDQIFSNGCVNMLSPTYMRSKNLYNLVSVVVHKGGVLDGHFIAYRRGAGRHSNSWFYTSDAEVCETTLNEVMQASAYMLFYTKCSNDAAC